jgi:hypothetical protein
MGYPSDISEEQWELIKEHFNTGNSGIRKKKIPQQSVACGRDRDCERYELIEKGVCHHWDTILNQTRACR